MEGNPKIPSNEYLTVRATTGFQRVRYFGWLSAAGPSTGAWRRYLHRLGCWTSSMGAELLARVSRDRVTPSLRWTAPHVFYVGRR